MHHHHYHQPPERGGLLANLITLSAGAFVAYAVAYASLAGSPPAPSVEVLPAVILEEGAMLDDDQAAIDSRPWI